MTLDRRLNAYRPDLADIRLRGQVEADSFIDGTAARICVSVADLRGSPSADAGLDTQFLRGDAVRVFERKDGWAWVQVERDDYVGYTPVSALAEFAEAPTHIVSVPRSFVYAEDDMKRPVRTCLSMGCGVTVTGFSERRGTGYAAVADGFMIAAHLAPADSFALDWVAVAETLERAPYLWGGTSAFGIDCSGLVQLSMRMAGRTAPRDTDMQAARLGAAIDPADGLRRGDLVFWKGHVAVMLDGETIIHANGHTMMVSREPLAQAVERIAHLYDRPTGYRRP